MKYYQKPHQSQQKLTQTTQLSQEIYDYFDSHAPSHRKMWEYILWMSTRIGKVYPTQSHIGDRGDIGRSQANLNLHEMARHGLLRIFNRGVKKTCVYRMPSWLNSQVLLQLSGLFPWLYDHVRYALLISCSESNYRTQVLKKNKKRQNKPDMTLSSAVTEHKVYSIPDRASPLPGSLAHDPIYNSKTFPKGDEIDYDAIANAIGAQTHW